MPQFKYIGVNRAGKRVQGVIDGVDEGEIRMSLRTQGIRPIKLAKSGVLQTDLGTLIKGGGTDANVGLQTIINFTRQLQVLISSGIPLVQALDALTDQAIEPAMKKILKNIREKVSSGSFFWECLNSYPRAFPRMYVALVRAGESSGSLDTVLKRLTRYLEDSARVRKVIQKAMIYPSMILLVAIGVIFGMMVFVVPKIAEMYQGSNQELPELTVVIMSTSKFLTEHFAIIGVLGIGGGFALFQFLRSPAGKAFFQSLFFRLPIMGSIMKKAAVARFTRTLGTLLGSGVNLVDATDVCRSTLDMPAIEKSVASIRPELEKGQPLSTILSRIPVFPKMAVQMVAVGESTGNLDSMLEKVADFYEAEVESAIDSMLKLIEPVMLVVLGGSVAVILLSVYLPIFKMAGGMGGE